MRKPTNPATAAMALSMIVYAVFGVSAQTAAAPRMSTVSEMLSPDVRAEISANGRAVRSSSGDPSLLPLHQASAGIRAALASEKPSILVEALFSLPRAKPANAATSSAELAALYGILRSVGTLQGIEYYSASHKAMRTLYAESYIIDSPASKLRQPDPKPPMPGQLPTAETFFAFQRDLSFGANTYRYDYAVFPEAISLKTTNLTRMSYSLVPVIASEGLTMRVLVIQADDAILFYVESGANAPALFKGKLQESFANRAEALFKWFAAKAAVMSR